MSSVFGNQVYNAPTMQSFGGIYASEAYSQFNANGFTPVAFEGREQVVVKPIDNVLGIGGKELVTNGRWTDEGATILLGLAAKTGDDGLRTFANKLLGDFGGLSDELTGLSDEALENAIRTKMVGANVGDKLQDTLSNLSKAGGSSRTLAQSIVKGLKKIPTKTGNMADDLLKSAKIRNQFRQCCGLKSLTPLVDDATSVGVKLADTPAGKRIEDGVNITINNSGAMAGGKEISNTLGGKMTGFGGSVMRNIWPIAGVGILFGGPAFVTTILGFVNIFGSWDDFDLLNLGNDDEPMPQCPNVGDTCDTNTVLAQGCYCEDDDGDGEGTIKQQKIAVNYEGWAFFGALAVGGIVTVGLVNSMLFPRR